MPHSRIVESPRQHQVRHGVHKAVFTNHRQELVRAEQTAFGMWPPQQCLDADDIAVVQIELGLVDQGQVDVGDRVTQSMLGEGTVTSVDADHTTVDFDKRGPRTLRSDVALLSPSTAGPKV